MVFAPFPVVVITFSCTFIIFSCIFTASSRFVPSIRSGFLHFPGDFLLDFLWSLSCLPAVCFAKGSEAKVLGIKRASPCGLKGSGIEIGPMPASQAKSKRRNVLQQEELDLFTHAFQEGKVLFWFLTGASKQIRKTVLRTVYKEDLEWLRVENVSSTCQS